MKEALIAYFESEFEEAQRLIEQNPYWISKPEVVHNALQRCLGVAQFAQICPDPVPFELVEPLYEELKQNLENLLTNP